MAKKTHSELALEALTEHEVKAKEKEEEITIPVHFSNRRRGFISCGFKREIVELPLATDYPVSVTDQIHALSLSQQVRQGIGESDPELDKSAFDFPDGVDDGSEAHGIFELSNRVDAWIAEQNLSDELKSSFRAQVLQQQADKAMKETLAKQKAQQSQQSQNVQVETQTQNNQNTQK